MKFPELEYQYGYRQIGWILSVKRAYIGTACFVLEFKNTITQCRTLKILIFNLSDVDTLNFRLSILPVNQENNIQIVRNRMFFFMFPQRTLRFRL